MAYKLTDKDNKIIDEESLKKINGPVDIYGFKDPQIIMQSGRNFIAVKERGERKDILNMGIIFQKEGDALNIGIKDNLEEIIHKNPQLGGNMNYYHKYIKYKTKYMLLKNSSNFTG